MDTELTKIRAWAKSKIDAGNEPPWAWYQYMKLVEAIDAIRAGAECATPMENSPQSEPHPERHLRPVDSTYRQDGAPHRPAGLPVLLPT